MGVLVSLISVQTLRYELMFMTFLTGNGQRNGILEKLIKYSRQKPCYMLHLSYYYYYYYYSLGLEEGLTTPHRKKTLLRNVTQGLGSVFL